MMIWHDEVMIISTSRLKRRRVAMVLEVVWRAFGLKWISTPALHMAIGSPPEKTLISLTSLAREFPDGFMVPKKAKEEK